MGDNVIKEKEKLGQQHLSELVQRLRNAAEANLVCVLVYGSAASDEFHPEFSDVNILCVLREASASNLLQLSAAVAWWQSNKYAAPIVFSLAEIRGSACAFPIEMLDIQQRHHVLYGDDIFKDLKVPMDRHRTQLEHELRTKLLFLRQHFLTSSADDDRLRHLMLDSVSNFATLFRHALIAMGLKPAQTKREVIEQLALNVEIDPSPFLELLQVREHKAPVAGIDAQAVFARYQQGITRVIEALEA
jgi:predicted nucleotidyltransferase